EARVRSDVPHCLDVNQPVRDEDEVSVALPVDLVSDVEAVVYGVLRLVNWSLRRGLAPSP
ncbi:MAG TPA: hypothetical protein VHI97_02570, partial [Actinomycetota bacterium]|nr:hypothetical protein [Actinomycetota bacterium]